MTQDNELIHEFVRSDDAGMQVDAQRGIIRGVKVLGLASRNGRVYPAETLREAAICYEGAKVNVNHPKGDPASPRDYQDRLGSIRDVVFRDSAGLFADLHFNPRHTLAQQLIWDAEHAPQNVGFSHNVRAVTEQKDGKTVVRKIVCVNSVDLVADPATTAGLFEAKDCERDTLREEIAALKEEIASLREQITQRSVTENFPSPCSREQRPEVSRPGTVREFVRSITR